MTRPRLSLLDLATVSAGRTEREALQRTVANARYAESLGAHPHLGRRAPRHARGGELRDGTCWSGRWRRRRPGSGSASGGGHARQPSAPAARRALRHARGVRARARRHGGSGVRPATDPRTSWALRRDHHAVQGEALLAEVGELLAFFDGDFPQDHPLAGMRSVPGPGLRPPLWLLGSSTFSAQVAALLGQRYAFAKPLRAPRCSDQALATYRQRFRPSADLQQPEVIVAATVICAPTEARGPTARLPAARSPWCGCARTICVRCRARRRALAHDWDELERSMREQLTASWIVGDPRAVRRGPRGTAAPDRGRRADARRQRLGTPTRTAGGWRSWSEAVADRTRIAA